MKATFIFLAVLFSMMAASFSFGAVVMGEKEQIEFISKLAKEARRDLWRAGYEEVSSSHWLMTKEAIDDYVKDENNSHYEDELDRDEVAQIYSCHFRDNCRPYLIAVSSEYYGGYGSEGIFILLNIQTGGYDKIRHVTYAE